MTARDARRVLRPRRRGVRVASSHSPSSRDDETAHHLYRCHLGEPTRVLEAERDLGGVTPERDVEQQAEALLGLADLLDVLADLARRPPRAHHREREWPVADRRLARLLLGREPPQRLPLAAARERADLAVPERLVRDFEGLLYARRLAREHGGSRLVDLGAAPRRRARQFLSVEARSSEHDTLPSLDPASAPNTERIYICGYT